MRRPVLILIAGWGYPSSVMSGLGVALSHDFQVHLTSTNELWARGVDSQTQGPYLSGLVSFISDIGVKPIVIGWSMGGMVALETAFSRPELVDRLVLVSTTAKFCADDGYAVGTPVQQVRAMALALKRDMQATMKRFFEQAVAPFVEPDSSMNDMVLAACSINADELNEGLVYLQRSDFRHCIPQIGIPVLVAHGKEDKIIPCQAGQLLNQELPVSRLCLYDNVGHALPFQMPAILASDIVNFIKNESW